LNDTPFPPAGGNGFLLKFVERGGGLLIVAGDRTTWPQNEAALLPGTLGPVVDRTSGRSGSLGGRPLLGDARLWVGVLLIAGSVLFFRNWQIAQQTRDIEETDTALLASELPIEAYLDRGFQNWLKEPQP